uniref:Uncharacterized protein n=1 Tax=Hanusia phi TaxID=3032 RepID=A0A7S0F1L9_9CRYP|mmetsp:Transcript_36217/g.81551  ORF Transcript_36217/g.81551 Transcript_36217/m.81551 type:complete len:471 (+) Transcript_36217:31-1443(+)
MLRLGKERNISDYIERVKDRRDIITQRFGSDGRELKIEQIKSSMRYREFEMTRLRYQQNAAVPQSMNKDKQRPRNSGLADFSSLVYHREKRSSSHLPSYTSASKDGYPPTTEEIRDRVVGLRNVGQSSTPSLYFLARDSEWKRRNLRFIQYMESKQMISQRNVHRNTSPDMFLRESFSDGNFSLRNSHDDVEVDGGHKSPGYSKRESERRKPRRKSLNDSFTEVSFSLDEFHTKTEPAQDLFTTSTLLSEQARSVLVKSPTDMAKSSRHVRERWPGPLLRIRSKSAEPVPFLGQAARQELYEPFRKTLQTSFDATYGPRADSLVPPMPIKGRRHVGSYKYTLTHSQSSAARMRLLNEQGTRLQELNLAMASENSFNIDDGDAVDSNGLGKVQVAMVKKEHESGASQQQQTLSSNDDDMALQVRDQELDKLYHQFSHIPLSDRTKFLAALPRDRRSALLNRQRAQREQERL